MKININEEEVNVAIKKAYNEAGHNAYFGEGFHAGIEWCLDIIMKQNENSNANLIKHVESEIERCRTYRDKLMHDLNVASKLSFKAQADSLHNDRAFELEKIELLQEILKKLKEEL